MSRMQGPDYTDSDLIPPWDPAHPRYRRRDDEREEYDEEDDDDSDD